MNEARTPAADTCPRCNAGFQCGMNSANPCWCTAVQLDAQTLATLRTHYRNCLCPGCLAELSRGATPE